MRVHSSRYSAIEGGSFEAAQTTIFLSLADVGVGCDKTFRCFLLFF